MEFTAITRAGCRIVLICFFCRLVVGREQEHRHATLKEKVIQPDSETPHIPDGTPERTIQSQQKEKRIENTPDIVRFTDSAHESAGDLLREFLQQKLGDVNQNLNRHPRHLRVTRYLFRLYSAMQDMDLLQSKQEHMDESIIPSVRTIKARIPGHTNSQSPRRRYMSFQTDERLVSKTSRCEIVVKLNEVEQMSSYRNFYLKVYVDDGKHYRARRYEDFLIFDISSDKDDIPEILYAQQHLLAESISLGDNSTLELTHRNEPALVVFENMKFNPLFESHTRSRRSVTTNSDPYNLISKFQKEMNFTASDTSILCKRHDWDIDMGVFSKKGWNWYIYPYIYNAGYCKGACTPPMQEKLNGTYYSFVKNLWRYTTGNVKGEVPGVCCTPVEYRPLTILYVDTGYRAVSAQMYNATVAACGCR